ncbi:MAG: SCO family protein [Alphaproteobacteria bacterium]|nr:SCO family protein [Alphaproteobacteria bacterium]MDE2109683.1 SCO family protein [Alphaproteobacteria bacterium]MDE2492384.1 SCO family protein [Alphaproteobacteria bacterium]
MIRTPLSITPYLLAAVVVAGGFLWHEGDIAAVRIQTQGVAAIGGPFLLTDQYGVSRKSADFRGRFMLVYFGYTYCPDVCPTTLAVIADALGKLGKSADRVAPIFITVDPERDTPGVLKAYLKSFDPRFIGLTGSPKAIAKAAWEYHVYYRKRPLAGGGYSLDHSSQIYLMGPDGKFIANYDETLGPDGLAAALRKYL